MKALRSGVAWLSLAGGFVQELVSATLDTIRAVLGDSSRLKPAIIAVPLDVKSDTGITVFADMVTLTPGTTSIDVSDDRKTLFVHALDAPDIDRSSAELKSSLEARVRRVLA
jgi:multicomponent Na+:H+ antiporter subunit E